jgi:hypothetical protein
MVILLYMNPFKCLRGKKIVCVAKKLFAWQKNCLRLIEEQI